MDIAVLRAFSDEVAKVATSAGGAGSLKLLDRSGVLGAIAPGAVNASKAFRPPAVGSFKVTTSPGIKKGGSLEGGSANADLKTTAEDYRTPEVVDRPRRKSAMEKLDRASWKQTAKDMPLVIAATGLGYGLSRTAVAELGKHLAKSGKVLPDWARTAIPVGVTAAGSLASYALGRSRNEMTKRREEARQQDKK